MGFLRPFCEGTFQSAFKSPFKSAFLKVPFRTPMSVLAFKGPFGKALLKALRAPSVVQIAVKSKWTGSGEEEKRLFTSHGFDHGREGDVNG